MDGRGASHCESSLQFGTHDLNTLAKTMLYRSLTMETSTGLWVLKARRNRLFLDFSEKRHLTTRKLGLTAWATEMRRSKLRRPTACRGGRVWHRRSRPHHVRNQSALRCCYTVRVRRYPAVRAYFTGRRWQAEAGSGRDWQSILQVGTIFVPFLYALFPSLSSIHHRHGLIFFPFAFVAYEHAPFSLLPTFSE